VSCQLAAEALRPEGETTPLGTVGVPHCVLLRRATPMLARAHLEGRVKPRTIVATRIPLEAINEGFVALERGESIGSKMIFP